MSTTSIIVSTSSLLTLISHIALAIFFVGIWLKVPVVKSVKRFIGRNTLKLSLLFASAGLFGSLLFSEVLGYQPCVLCWIGRIFLYPQVVLIAVAMYFKERIIEKYIVALSLLGALVTLYHSYTQLGGRSLTPCTADGGACSILYFIEYGYITIPLMAFTAFFILIVIFWCGRESQQ